MNKLPYGYYCDEAGLKRIGASHEEHLANLDRMASDLLALRQVHLDAIAARCPHCGCEKRRESE